MLWLSNCLWLDSIFIRHAAANNAATTYSSKQYITHFLGDCQNQLNIKTEHRRIDLHLQLSLTRRTAILLGLASPTIDQS